MPTYRNCACAICYMPLKRPQNTCGSRECLDAWKFLGREARLKHLNLASMTKSEREFCLASGPTPEELEAQATQRALLNDELTQHEAAQERKQTPKFIREMLDPSNLESLIKKEGGDNT